MATYIIDAVRTPRGRGTPRGSLKTIAPAQLLAQLARHLRDVHHLDTSRIADAHIGCVTQTGEQGGNVGRVALLAAGWSDRCPAMTLSRYCASSLSATLSAALRAEHDDALTVAGGVEMMSRVPFAADQPPLVRDDALIAAQGLVPIGVAADAVATRDGYDRARCDAFALRSQQRAARARAERRFRLVPVHDAGGALALAEDETIRADLTAERLAALPPSFTPGHAGAGFDAAIAAHLGLAAIEHVHHVGSSPALADAASLVLLGTARAARSAGLTPRARLVAGAEVGADRTLALTGIVDASRRALARAHLGVDDIDLFEVNESFSALMLHYQRELGVDDDRLNANGGAIALGHPMGATGAILLGMALDELERRGGRRALIAIGGAAGVATAAILERV